MANLQAFRCTVCGYVHRGEAAPPECPVCGSPRERFEPYTDPTAAEPSFQAAQWVCLSCGFTHKGQSPPDHCPVCGSPDKQFEAVADIKTASIISAAKSRIIVVGAGIAGLAAVESIRNTAPETEITLFTKETALPYYRLNLTRFLAGEILENQLPIHPRDWYTQNRINLVQAAEITDLLLSKKQVKLKNGGRHAYDHLVLTAGAHAFMPPLPGARMAGVTALRTLEDARLILAEAGNARRIVVIGGGILGLEAAGALAKKTEVILLESFHRLMPRQLDQTAADLLQNYLGSIGIQVRTGITIQELVGDERVAGVVLKGGELIAADLVIIAAGVRSNSYLARLAGLRVDGGVVVNDQMQTSDPNVYAAGDIAEHRGVLYGLWNAAQYQGSIAGLNAAGQTIEFGGIPRSNSLKVLGVDLLSIGKFEPQDGSDLVIAGEKDGKYSRFVFRDSHLIGCILFGDTTMGTEIKHAIENRQDFSRLLTQSLTAADIHSAIVR